MLLIYDTKENIFKRIMKQLNFELELWSYGRDEKEFYPIIEARYTLEDLFSMEAWKYRL